MLHNLKSYMVYIDESDPEDFVIDFAYDGDCVLVPLIDFNIMRDNLESTNSTLDDDDIVFCATKSTLRDFHGGTAKIGCGRKAQAMMIANVVSGMKQKDVLKRRYPCNKQGQTRTYCRTTLITATTVNSIDDLVRIQSLLDDFPDVFYDSGVSVEAVKSWAVKKLEKQSKRKPDKRTHPDEQNSN